MQRTTAASARVRVRRLLEVVAWSRLATLSGFQKDATLFAPVGGWGREGAGGGSETPFLDVSFDEYEAELAKVYVDGSGAVGADSREEIQ